MRAFKHPVDFCSRKVPNRDLIALLISLPLLLMAASECQGAPTLTINGVNADYTTTHLFVDELAGDSIPLTVLLSPNTANVTAAEVFSNLNRRERAGQDANGDGIEDGIVPPDGNGIAAGDDGNYYKA